MATSRRMTAFAGLSPRGRFCILATLVTLYALAIMRPTVAPMRPLRAAATVNSEVPSDLRQYRRIVDRVHARENYYDVYREDLEAHGYHFGSVVNFRTPLLLYFQSCLPAPEWSRGLMAVLSVVALAATFRLLAGELDLSLATMGTLLTGGALGLGLSGDCFFSQEAWAGLLLLGSFLAYASDRFFLGAIFALWALFVRELAAGYCVVAFALSLYGRRRDEIVLWLIGFIGYAIHFSLHAWSAAARTIGAPPMPYSQWLQCLGIGFVLDTVRMNLFLFPLPTALVAIYLAMAILGSAARMGRGRGLLLGVLMAYTVAFSIVGQPFNDYWGLLVAPLLPIGFAWGVPAFRDLVSVHRVVASKSILGNALATEQNQLVKSTV